MMDNAHNAKFVDHLIDNLSSSLLKGIGMLILGNRCLHTEEIAAHCRGGASKKENVCNTSISFVDSMLLGEGICINQEIKSWHQQDYRRSRERSLCALARQLPVHI
jgi:hypothetical protein